MSLSLLAFLTSPILTFWELAIHRYQQAQVCYAYLWDISSECPPLSDDAMLQKECKGNGLRDGDQDGQKSGVDPKSDGLQQWRATFTDCSWFTRGW